MFASAPLTAALKHESFFWFLLCIIVKLRKNVNLKFYFVLEYNKVRLITDSTFSTSLSCDTPHINNNPNTFTRLKTARS